MHLVQEVLPGSRALRLEVLDFDVLDPVEGVGERCSDLREHLEVVADLLVESDLSESTDEYGPLATVAAITWGAKKLYQRRGRRSPCTCVEDLPRGVRTEKAQWAHDYEDERQYNDARRRPPSGPALIWIMPIHPNGQ